MSVRFTGRPDGDLAGTGADADSRRRAIVDLPWVHLRQVHGAVVRVVGPSPDDQVSAVVGESVDGDALVTAENGIALAVLTADCAPVALSSSEGVIGVAHAGWRGLGAGVIEATVEEMRRLGARNIDAVVGPCIHPCCYEFSRSDMVELIAVLGEEIVGVDRHGHAALDLPRGVEIALRRADVDQVSQTTTCTACGGEHFSWRARRDWQRQATVIWQ